MGTGFGRLFDESKREEFYSTDGDVESLGMFIDNFLSRYNRHNSPILLAGESYGTGRSACWSGNFWAAAPRSRFMQGVAVSGVMLLGSFFFCRCAVEKAVL